MKGKNPLKVIYPLNFMIVLLVFFSLTLVSFTQELSEIDIYFYFVPTLLFAVFTFAVSLLLFKTQKNIKLQRTIKIILAVLIVLATINLVYWLNLANTGSGLGMIGVAIIFGFSFIAFLVLFLGTLNYFFLKYMQKVKLKSLKIYLVVVILLLSFFLISPILHNKVYQKEVILLEEYKANMNLEGCQSLTKDLTRTKCLHHIAIETNNHTLCQDLPGTGFYGQCIYTIANNTNNEEICDLVAFPKNCVYEMNKDNNQTG